MNKILFLVFAFIPSIAFAQISGGLDYESSGGGGVVETPLLGAGNNGALDSCGNGCFEAEDELGLTANGQINASYLNLRNTGITLGGAERVLSAGSGGTEYFGVHANLNDFEGNAVAITYSGLLINGVEIVKPHAGTPEGVDIADIGSVFMQTDGGNGAPTLWSKVSGMGTNTGWRPIMQGDMYIAGEVVDVSTDTTISIAVSNTYYEVTSVNFDAATACGLEYWTNDDGGLTPDSNVAYGKYNFIAPLYFSAGNGNIVEFIVKSGSTEIGHCHAKMTMSTTAIDSTTLHCPICVTDTSELTLWVKNSAAVDVVIGDATTWFVER